MDLKSLYKACENKNTLLPYTNINYKYVEGYKHEDSSHEAGYDSFMTGCAFIGMLNCLYEINKEPIVFSKAFEENKLLYSRFAGEISLVGPVFTPKTREYGGRIVVFGGLKKDHNWEQLGERLSRFGTLSVVEDHGETYYAFDL